MIRIYFKSAWRSLWKNRMTSLINISGLSIGMTASVLILLWVQNELRFDDFNPDASHTYRVNTHLIQLGWNWESTPLLLAPVASKQIPEIAQTIRMNPDNQAVITISGSAFYEKSSVFVDSNWFSFFHYDFVEGNANAFLRNPYSVVLTASQAKKYFGQISSIGKVLQIDNLNYTVSAIVKDAPANSSFQYKTFIPLAALLRDPERRSNDEDWGNANYNTFIKTRPGVSPTRVAEKLTELVRKNSNSQDVSLSLTPLLAMHLDKTVEQSDFPRGSINTVYTFSALAFILLLIACINYVNLTTAKSSLRSREVSIRKIVGAARIQLFYQFIAESLLVSLISIALTVFLIRLSLPAYNAFTEKDFELPWNSTTLWTVLSLTLGVAVLLTSIYPAILLSSFKPLNIFRGISILKVKNSYFRKGLVVLQFTMSVILISGTLIIYRQMKFVQQSDPGYDRSQVFAITLPASIDQNSKASKVRAIKEHLLRRSGIEAVSCSNQNIVDVGSYCSLCADWNGRDTSFRPKLAQLSVDEDYLRTLRLNLVDGRWFEKDKMNGKHGFILNEAAVQLMNLPKPVIGQHFIFKGDTGQVIGIVKNFHYKSLHDAIGPMVIFNDPQRTNWIMVRASAKNAALAVDAARKTWSSLLPGLPMEFQFVDDGFNNLYKQDQQTASLIFVFAIIAVIVSAMGLFGLAAFAAEQRTREIGIRKVLGATVASISGMLSSEFVKLVLVAMVIAIPIAHMAFKPWIENFAYRVNLSWWIYLLAGLVALFIALCTISYQAIRAARENPVNSLRSS